MICPLKPQAYDLHDEEYPDARCDEENCAWWDSEANYNSKTKKYDGQCCILTLAQLDIIGKVDTHPY